MNLHRLLLFVCFASLGCDQASTTGPVDRAEPRYLASNNAFDEPTNAGKSGEIAIQREIPFCVEGEPYQTFDLFLPAGDGPFPVTVCYFGGAFVMGDKKSMSGVGKFLAANGIAAAAPGYFLTGALSGKPAWPRNVHDAKCIVRFLRQHADQYQLDTDKMAVLGHSSGAYLAMMVGFTPHLQELEGDGGWEQQSSRVSAVVNIAGVCDRRGDLGIGTKYLLGAGSAQNDGLRELASPVFHLNQKSPPVYTLHGDQDDVVPVASARQLDAALKEAGVDHRLQIVPQADHNPISPKTLDSIAKWLRERLEAG